MKDGIKFHGKEILFLVVTKLHKAMKIIFGIEGKEEDRNKRSEIIAKH